MSLQSFIDYLSTSFFCLLNLQCEYRKYVLQILIFFEYPFMFLPTDSFADFTLQPVVYGLLPYPILCCQIHHFLTTLHLPQYLYLHLPCYPCHILTFHFTAILQSLCIITGAGQMQKLRGIRKDKFMIHLKESEWRWNHRNENIYKTLLKILTENPLF